MHRHLRNNLLLMNRRRAITYARWNSADKAAGVTLSNNDLTAQAGGGWWGARATVGKLSGDWFYAGTFDAGSYTGFGVATDAQRLTYPGDNGGDGWGISSHGYNMDKSGVNSNGVTFTTGDIVGVSLLRSTSRAKFYKLVAGAWSLVWNADVSDADGLILYPMFAGLDGTSTGNFGGSAFPAAVPDGCQAGFW